MSKKAPTVNQLAWCSSFIGSHFDPYDEPLTFDELRKRIMGKVTYLFLPSYLAWTRKIQLLQRWDSMWEPFDGPEANSWNKKGKDECLAIPRHGTYDVTLGQADYVKNVTDIDCILTGTIYFKNGRKRSGLFWLITSSDSEAPFVYAIFKSSMFKAWCSLTANTDGRSDFTEGMWNTFPLPALTKEQKDRIIEAGAEVLKARENYPDASWADLYDPDKMPPDFKKALDALNEIVDALFNLPCSATDEDRKNMLASGFYETFQGI